MSTLLEHPPLIDEHADHVPSAEPPVKKLRPRIYSTAQTPAELDALFDAEVYKAQKEIISAYESGIITDPTQNEDPINDTAETVTDINTAENPDVASVWNSSSMTSLLETTAAYCPTVVQNISRKYSLDEDTCEDIVADAQVRLWQAANKGKFSESIIEDDETVRRIFNHVVKYSVKDHMRKTFGRYTKRELPLSLEAPAYDDGPSLIDVIDIPAQDSEAERNVETAEAIKKIMPRLTEAERRIVLLYGYYNLKHADIAAITGKSANTVNQHIVKLKKKLRAQEKAGYLAVR